MAQDRAGELGEEALDQVEPGAVLGRDGELETAGRSSGKPSCCLPRDVCGMIVEDQLDRGAGRIIGSRSLRNSMNSRLRWRSLTRAWTLPVSRSILANRLSVP